MKVEINSKMMFYIIYIILLNKGGMGMVGPKSSHQSTKIIPPGGMIFAEAGRGWPKSSH